MYIPAAGFSIFTAGLLLSGSNSGTVLMITGALVTLVFYFITLFDVIGLYRKGLPKSIFWVIGVICLPVIGNIIYVIFREMANKKQVVVTQ